MNVVHIIPEQKFTMGYINFMMSRLKQCRHLFLITPSLDLKFELPNKYTDIIWRLDSFGELRDRKCRDALSAADKVIVTGIFGIDKELIRLSRSVLRKTYLHFWGGDFYGFRDVRLFSKKYAHKLIMRRVINRCAGIVTLVPGDYDELSKIFQNSKPHFTASMPDDPCVKDDYAKYIDKRRGNKILVGNSATPENHHFEVLDKLSHLKDEEIEIICPLAYGDMEYAKSVEEYGKRIFKKKFRAVFEYQKFEEYKRMLADCAVGIFANDRQQAMGNIGMMMMMGRKVYLREGTSMWKSYVDYGMKINSISELGSISMEELFEYDVGAATFNASRLRKRDRDRAAGWEKVLGA